MKSKKQILKYLQLNLVEPNASKYLNGKLGTKYFLYFRDRAADQTYYLINIKGNCIRGYTLKYSNNIATRKFANTFLVAMLSGSNPVARLTFIKTLILKTKIQEYKGFAEQFRELTPVLGWWDDFHAQETR